MNKFAFASLLLACSTLSLAQTFTVDGKVPTPLKLSAADLKAMPRAELKVKDHGGKDATYSGVPVRAILEKAGAPIGNHQMRGPNAALYVVANASDGYVVVFALAEFDAEVAEHNILLADTRDGQALAGNEAPLRLVVPDEKLQARWIRGVESLTLMSARGE